MKPTSLSPTSRVVIRHEDVSRPSLQLEGGDPHPALGSRSLAHEVARGDRARSWTGGEETRDRRELDVRNEEIRLREVTAPRVERSHVDLDAVPGRILARDFNGDRINVDGMHRVEAEADGSDRDHSRAAARVENPPSWLPREQLDAGTRRRVSTGSESAAGIDHDGEISRGRGLPRRTDPEAARPLSVVELTPTLTPARLDGCCSRARERVGDLEDSDLVGIDGELDRGASIDLLEAFRGEPEQARSCRLRVDRVDLDRDAEEAG